MRRTESQDTGEASRSGNGEGVSSAVASFAGITNQEWLLLGWLLLALVNAGGILLLLIGTIVTGRTDIVTGLLSVFFYSSACLSCLGLGVHAGRWYMIESEHRGRAR